MNFLEDIMQRRIFYIFGISKRLIDLKSENIKVIVNKLYFINKGNVLKIYLKFKY